MKPLVLLLCCTLLAGCTSPFEKTAEKSSGDTLLAPSIAAKAKPDDVKKDVKAQGEWLDSYRGDWNRTAARAFGATEVDQLPQIIEMHPATYPPDMHLLNKQATVMVDFIVDKDGTVVYAFPVEMDAQPFQFTASAIVAVWSWKFHPALKNGQPVKVRMRVPIKFRID